MLTKDELEAVLAYEIGRIAVLEVSLDTAVYACTARVFELWASAVRRVRARQLPADPDQHRHGALGVRRRAAAAARAAEPRQAERRARGSLLPQSFGAPVRTPKDRRRPAHSASRVARRRTSLAAVPAYEAVARLLRVAPNPAATNSAARGAHSWIRMSVMLTEERSRDELIQRLPRSASATLRSGARRRSHGHRAAVHRASTTTTIDAPRSRARGSEPGGAVVVRAAARPCARPTRDRPDRADARRPRAAGEARTRCTLSAARHASRQQRSACRPRPGHASGGSPTPIPTARCATKRADCSHDRSQADPRSRRRRHEDFEATVAFYKALGAKVEVSGGGEHEIWHGDVKFPNGASLHIDNVALAATYNAAWRREGGSSSVVIGFSVASRGRGRSPLRKLTEDEGYEGRQVPYDAFWGARYAIVADPNGIDVGIMSPSTSRSPDDRRRCLRPTSDPRQVRQARDRAPLPCSTGCRPRRPTPSRSPIATSTVAICVCAVSAPPGNRPPTSSGTSTGPIRRTLPSCCTPRSP